MLSDKLMRLRKKQGLSQQEVAAALGVSRQTVSNWEAGQGAPALDKAAALARLYHVTVDELANDAVEVSTSQASASKDLHALFSLVGATCYIDCEDVEWQVSMANRKVVVVDVDEEWMRVRYARAGVLGRGDEVIRLIDVADLRAIEIVERPPVDAGACEPADSSSQERGR